MIVKIEGKEYPFLFSFSAIQEHQDRAAKKGKPGRGMDEMRIFIILGLKWGCKFNDIKYDLSEATIAKWMELNMREALPLVKHCTTEYTAFNGLFAPEIEESEKKPKAQMKKAG